MSKTKTNFIKVGKYAGKKAPTIKQTVLAILQKEQGLPLELFYLEHGIEKTPVVFSNTGPNKNHRAAVYLALKQLTAEGLIHKVEGRGYFLNEV
jgi:Fe2+ or Zn2+ uptake regulation protein